MYDWRYENSINSGKEPLDLDGVQEAKYSQWRTNNSLSNFQETILYSNEMNMNYHLTDKMHYQYLFYSVRKAKRFGKKEDDKVKRKREKEQKEKEELHSLIQSFYKYNDARTKEAIRILSPEQIDIIRKKQEKGGVR
jgi:hypothetical protein